jgi:hypothetical protein
MSDADIQIPAGRLSAVSRSRESWAVLSDTARNPAVASQEGIRINTLTYRLQAH